MYTVFYASSHFLGLSQVIRLLTLVMEQMLFKRFKRDTKHCHVNAAVLKSNINEGKTKIKSKKAKIIFKKAVGGQCTPTMLFALRQRPNATHQTKAIMLCPWMMRRMGLWICSRCVACSW